MCKQQFYNFDRSQTMYTGFKPNTSVSKSIAPGLGETQLETLQREVDTYTRKLEQEKKKYFGIQDTHKSVTEEYQKEKAKLDQLKKQSSKAHNVVIQAKIKNLQANLQKAVSTYDETLSNNVKLKQEIDMLRREKRNYIQSKKSLQEQIVEHEKQIEKKMIEIQSKKNTAESLKSNIVQIKQRNQKQRNDCVQRFDKLEKDYMKQKRQREMYKFEKDQKPEPIDTQPLLKFRLQKLIKANKSKIKLIEQYKKHMKQIEEGFNQIKKNSGINDLTEITNTFIKSQQQNYSLYNYMDSLSRNIDSLEKANAQLEQRIQKQDQSDIERKRSLESMPEQERKKKQLQHYVQKKEEANQQLKKLIEAVKPSLSSTLIELANSQLNDDPSKVAEYQLGINITDRTIQGYLSDLERFINNLLMLRQEAKPKTVSSMKDSATVYSKPIPNIVSEDVAVKDKVADTKEEQKFMEEGKFRQYAIQYWEKKKHKSNGINNRD